MKDRPKRVLHVVRAMDRAGVENWLMNVLRRVDRGRVEMDFLVHTRNAGVHDSEIADRGARLVRCTSPLWSPSYPLRIGRILHRFGPYDAIHSHVHHFSGYLVALARRSQVPIRIAHSHSDTTRLDAGAGRLRAGYLNRMRRLVRRDATRLVAVSQRAAHSLFGEGWASDPRSLVMHCGIDPTPFRQIPSLSPRAAWNLADDDFVVGHVGRFDTPKNHQFLVEIFAAILRARPQARLVLVGDGALREAIEARVRSQNIAGRTVFTGAQDNVAQLLRAMDVCVFPSLHEGLPLSVVEAQAAGVPCVLSDGITDEADAVPGLVHRVSLSQPAARWAAVVLAANRIPAPNKRESLRLIEESSFNIARSMEQLYALYNA